MYITVLVCTKTPSRKMKSSKVKWIDNLNVQLLLHWTLLHFSLQHTSSLGGRQLLGNGGLTNLQKWLQRWLKTFFNPPRTDIWNIVFWQGLTVWLHSDLKMLMILSTKSHGLTIAGHASFKTGILWAVKHPIDPETVRRRPSGTAPAKQPVTPAPQAASFKEAAS